MLESLLLYALSIYFLYHVLNRSELLARPRAILTSLLPYWLTKPVTCAFCFTFWCSVAIVIWIWATTGVIFLSNVPLMAAPVVNAILDLLVRRHIL